MPISSTFSQQLAQLWQAVQNAGTTSSSNTTTNTTTQDTTSGETQTSPAIIVDTSTNTSTSDAASLTTVTKVEQDAAKAALATPTEAAESQGETTAAPAADATAPSTDPVNGPTGGEVVAASEGVADLSTLGMSGLQDKGWNKAGEGAPKPARTDEVQKAEEDAEMAASRAAAERVQAKMLQESLVSLIGSTNKVGISLKPIENASTERASGSYAATVPKPDAAPAKQRVSVAA